ncbi:hypothetical protein MRB53_039546 [Persea americana]|nr:hypothetical protein MRB53_039546 [Persea americana]
MKGSRRTVFWSGFDEHLIQHVRQVMKEMLHERIQPQHGKWQGSVASYHDQHRDRRLTIEAELEGCSMSFDRQSTVYFNRVLCRVGSRSEDVSCFTDMARTPPSVYGTARKAGTDAMLGAMSIKHCDECKGLAKKAY